MFPVVTVLGKEMPPYMLCALVGALSAVFVSCRIGKKNGLDDVTIITLSLLSFLGVGIGGALLYGVTKIRTLWYILTHLELIQSFSDVLTAVQLVFGGSVFYGGLIGMILVSLAYVRRKKLSRDYIDLTAAAIPLFHAWGRVGCFLGGCCFGIECSFGFVYHYSPIEMANGVRRLPVSLFEAIFNAALSAFLYGCFRKKKHRGYLLNIYLYAYPVWRFVIEFFRGDSYRGFLWIFSTSQWVSIGLIAVNTAVLLCRARKRSAAAPVPAAETAKSEC